MNQSKKTLKKASGLLFVGCIMLGMAAGFIINHPPIGLFGGLAMGFFVKAGIMVAADQYYPEVEEDYDYDEVVD